MPVRDLAKPSGAQAIDRAAHLLTQVVDATHSVTFSELAESTGLAKSTTSRLLTALERNGLLRREAGGAFVPGDAFVRYALRGSAETDLVAVATPYLERLGEVSHETINLGVIRNGLVEQIAQVDSRFVLGGTNWLGRAEPVHCTALGKVLVAFGAASLPPGRLKRLTASTITSRALLEDELATVRRRGYAVAHEELESGLVAIAAPVRRHDGVVIAALSVSGPSSRLTAARVRELAAHCIAEADALSGVLGYPSQEEGAS
ncbi:MAG: IclR family transcriptional regulator [Acidobacteriota bacterium]|nr:IclR family transcriptional regulator [Acidobacteriota bacterium]